MRSDALEQLRVACVCGWSITGTQAEVVPAVLEHGERVHNMRGTPEAVLANAERLGVASGEEPAGQSVQD